jgi:hypothetical protein
MKIVKILGVGLGVVVLAAGAVAGGVYWKSESILHTTHTVHEVDFPIPFPLSE